MYKRQVFLPAIDVKTTHAVLALSREYPGYAYPMIGWHPEEVKEDWKEQLAAQHFPSCDAPPVSSGVQPAAPSSLPSPLQDASQS